MSLRERAITGARWVWRRFAPGALRTGLGRLVGPAFTRAALALSPPPGPSRPSVETVVVTSFFEDASGIGIAGALAADALERAGFSVIRHDARRAIGPQGGHDLPGPPDSVWLVCCNAPEARAVMARTRRGSWHGRRRVAYWHWELTLAPPGWEDAARLFDEVWVSSVFTASAFAGWATPVRAVPLPVPVGENAAPDHARFGFDPSRLMVLAMADFGSTAARKNPQGALEVFTAAFPRPQEAVTLVLKLSGADPQALEGLRAKAASRPDIRLMTERLSPADMSRLMRTADIFLSMHRAEGFGLGVAQAQAVGRPALATDWSANTEFMPPDDAVRVSCTLAPVPPQTPVYGAVGGQWAEPDIADGARKLRRLLEDAGLRARMGAQGRERIAAFSAEWTRLALLARFGPLPC